MSNIWTAAGEGNLARVHELVESGISPSVADDNTYTPLHAAASWGHVDILRYLVSKGGDINITDEDGETPLFVVETVEMARLVLELGGNAEWKNAEGMTAAESLAEDHPHVALYLRTLSVPDLTSRTTSAFDPNGTIDTPQVDAADSGSTSLDLDAPTDALIARVRTIMEASERGELSSQEVDDQLRGVVEEAVVGQVEAGRIIGEVMKSDMDTTSGNGTIRNNNEDNTEDGGVKRSRVDEAGR